MNARVASSIAIVAVLLAGCGSGQDAANDSVAPVAADRATMAPTLRFSA